MSIKRLVTCNLTMTKTIWVILFFIVTSVNKMYIR